MILEKLVNLLPEPLRLVVHDEMAGVFREGELLVRDLLDLRAVGVDDLLSRKRSRRRGRADQQKRRAEPRRSAFASLDRAGR